MAAPAAGELTSGPRFHLHQFLAQLPLQLTAPLSPLLLAPLLPGLAANVLALPKPWRWGALPAVAFFTLVGLAPYATLAAWALSPASSPALDATLRADVVHVAVGFLAMRLAVCFKYAFLDPRVYAARLAQWAPSADRSDDQLISTWLALTPGTIAREVALASAAKRHWPSPQAGALAIPAAALPRLRALLGDANTFLEDALRDAAAAAADAAAEAAGGAFTAPSAAAAAAAAAAAEVLHVPVEALCCAILHCVSRGVQGFQLGGQRFLFIVAALGTFSTTAVRAALGEPALGGTLLQGVVVVAHWASNLLIMGVVFSFLFIGAVDHRRRAGALGLLGRLFASRGGQEPLLALHSPAQVRAFLAARGTLLAFGSVYHERLVLVTSAFLVLFVVMGGYCCVVLFLVAAADVGPLASACVLLHVLVLPAFVVCGLGLYEAAEANAAAARHVAVVVGTRVQLRLRADFDGAKEGALLALLEDVERGLQEQAGVSILGVPATMGLLASYGGLWLSLEAFALTTLLARLYGK